MSMGNGNRGNHGDNADTWYLKYFLDRTWKPFDSTGLEAASISYRSQPFCFLFRLFCASTTFLHFVFLPLSPQFDVAGFHAKYVIFPPLLLTRFSLILFFEYLLPDDVFDLRNLITIHVT